LTDQQALEFSIVENLQRADVHFMDEAKGFVRLMAIDEKTTPELLAEKLGKSKAYVYQRLALNKLIPKLEELACHDKLSLGVALKLARLTPKIQQAALDYIVQESKRGQSVTSGDVQEFLERHVYVDLARAPFDVNHTELVPKAGACPDCPKRTGSSPMLFAEIRSTDTCTDTNCFKAKCNALIQIRLKEHPGALRITLGETSYEERQVVAREHIIQQDLGYGW
jgi:ParB family transcriptional regulator, chromosome partitioning protein